MTKQPRFVEFDSFVKQVPLSAQFQGFRVQSAEGRGVIEWRFYPGGTWVLARGKIEGAPPSDENHRKPGFWNCDLKSFECSLQAPISRGKTHPLAQYVAAHFKNRRLSEVQRGKFSDQWVLIFDQHRIALRPAESGRQVEFVCEVPGKKPYEIRFTLAECRARSTDRARPFTEIEPAIEPLSKIGDRLLPTIADGVPGEGDKAYQRLLARVRSDIEQAERMLTKWRPIIEALREQPALSWNQIGDQLSPNQQRDLITLFPQSVKSRNDWRDRLFRSQKRHERKLQLASQRLEQLLHRGPVQDSNRKAPVKPIERARSQRERAQLPGIEVEGPEGLLFRVGRSAKDNDQLLRWATGNDHWFHVRGVTGSHVWLTRRQQAWSGALTPAARQFGAQLALYFSKARSSQRGEVDFTEKRYLKKIKATPGAVVIERSEVLFVSIDPNFVRLLLREQVND